MVEKKLILFLDPTVPQQIKVALYQGRKKLREKKARQIFNSQKLLILIEEIMKEEKISFSHLCGFKIVPGPGSFTGLKVGAAVVNTLAWFLDLPINGKKIFFEPNYGRLRANFKSLP